MIAPGSILTLEKVVPLVDQWDDFVARNRDWESLIDGVVAEESASGTVYPIEAEGLTGEAAVVDMRNVAIDEAHYHTGGEWEAHVPIVGQSTLWAGGYKALLEPKRPKIIQPETAHFMLPRGYVGLVVSLPDYKPENEISLLGDEEIPKHIFFNRAYYLGLVALHNAKF